MESGLFRQKSLDKISSPEELNAYMRVANPSVWITVTALLILLAGAIFWGITGYVQSSVPAVVVSRGGDSQLYLSERYADSVQPGMAVSVDGQSLTLAGISSAPLPASESLSDYALYIGGFREGEYVFRAELSSALPDGTVSADIVTERVHAMSFLWN